MIYKFTIPAFNHDGLSLGTHRVYAPPGTTWLSVGIQFGAQLVVWGLLPRDYDQDEGAQVLHYFVVAGTGRPITDPIGRFLGTVQVGGLVAHVFEHGV